MSDRVYIAEFDGMVVRFCVESDDNPEILDVQVADRDQFLSSNISDEEESEFLRDPVAWVTANYVTEDDGEWILAYAAWIRLDEEKKKVDIEPDFE
jgi:hypothetical protein